MSRPEHIDGRIKMVINTKAGYQNVTWGSFKRLDANTDDFIIQGMIDRFKKTGLDQVTQVLQFYCNNTGNLLREVKDYETYNTKKIIEGASAVVTKIA
jgi:hypothetical protein